MISRSRLSKGTTRLLILIEDEIFLAHSIGLLLNLKNVQDDFLVVLPKRLIESHKLLLCGLNLDKYFHKLETVEAIFAETIISQWGSPLKKRVQKNWLMHLDKFEANKIVMIPHGLEIKNQVLLHDWKKKIRSLLKPSYSEYSNINYFFDSDFHFSRYKDIKYFKKNILKNPTFHSIYTPEITECVKNIRGVAYDNLVFCPKIKHVGYDNFIFIVKDAIINNYSLRLHPRETDLQKSIIDYNKLKPLIISQFSPIDILQLAKVYDYGTSVSALAKLVNIDVSLTNLTASDTIFEWSGWETFRKMPEDFLEFNEHIK